MRRALKWRWMVRAAPLRMRLLRHDSHKGRPRALQARRALLLLHQLALHGLQRLLHSRLSDLTQPSQICHLSLSVSP